MTYDYSGFDFLISHSELNGALGHEHGQHHYSQHSPFANLFAYNQFPGPYHPDIFQQQQYSCMNDALPFSSVESSEMESVATPARSHKRRRMSTDSASEPPSTAVSFSSYGDGYSLSSSATSVSQRSSMELSSFGNFPSFDLRGGGLAPTYASPGPVTALVPPPADAPAR